ncbi:MAG: YggS family pyridoxal phosphate-dependent enzyme [Candidatus Heimdallarchaeaceae archaeon]
MIPSLNIKENYLNVLHKIETCTQKVGRDPSEITLVGVTKRIEFERIKPALDAGLKVIGEVIDTNLKKKFSLIKNNSPEVRIHVIGKLQSNKVKFAVERCHLIQSIQTEKILSLVNQRASKLDITFPIFLQVDCSGVHNPKGLNVKQALHFLKLTEHYPFIEVQGIMTIAPLEFEKSEKKLRKFFKKTFHEYKEKILPHLSFASPQLSMGMSNDFTIAIEEGSTMVRIGTAIFGPRN